MQLISQTDLSAFFKPDLKFRQQGRNVDAGMGKAPKAFSGRTDKGFPVAVICGDICIALDSPNNSPYITLKGRSPELFTCRRGRLNRCQEYRRGVLYLDNIQLQVPRHRSLSSLSTSQK
ncbi:hypothetical protein LOAG_08256 [Loa loa]|uniref:Uncharacterized protein n=1 Tax=Loa loa TaxID=7209 RepID=A0A1S0TUU9_LOALO|nr:hypothetical protein LOAG_08256 [Loa loa]EFO20234.1 hypothetical protein LOAG_08256 [Loa loa]